MEIETVFFMKHAFTFIIKVIFQIVSENKNNRSNRIDARKVTNSIFPYFQTFDHQLRIILSLKPKKQK